MKIKITLIIFVLWVISVKADDLKNLRDGFLHPPKEGWSQTWWHWTSPFVTQKGITADLESMKAVGYSGAHLFVTGSSPYPDGQYPEMLSREWLDLLEHAGKEAKRLGLMLGVHNCPGWSLSGGPWIKPEEAMQMIVASSDGAHYREVANFDYKIRTDLQFPKCIRLKDDSENLRFFRITFMHRPYRVWMRPVNVKLNGIRLLTSPMVPDVDSRNSAMEDSYSYKPFPSDYISEGICPAEIVDLSDKLLPGGILQWQPPKGNWTVLRIGHTTTGKCNAPATLSGLECDKLNKKGLDAHWQGMMSKIIERIGYLGVLKYCIIDSYEAGGQNWTPGFETEFLKRRGYSLRPYLPAVVGYVVGKPSESARFLYDFQRTVADLFAENYYDYFTELCHNNGLLSVTESYFGPFDYLRCARKADIPAGEFWIGSKTPISSMHRSVGHFHGKKHVAAEAFTTDEKQGRWLQDPQQLKEYGDRAWAQGISQLVSHSFVHQPFLNVRPGFTLGRHGSHLSRTNTWWNYAEGWFFKNNTEIGKSKEYGGSFRKRE